LIFESLFSFFIRCSATDKGCTSQNNPHGAEPVEDLIAEREEQLKKWQQLIKIEVSDSTAF
jgi:hypothetical protein